MEKLINGLGMEEALDKIPRQFELREKELCFCYNAVHGTWVLTLV